MKPEQVHSTVFRIGRAIGVTKLFFCQRESGIDYLAYFSGDYFRNPLFDQATDSRSATLSFPEQISLIPPHPGEGVSVADGDSVGVGVGDAFLRFDLLFGVGLGDGVGEAFFRFREVPGAGVGVGFFPERVRCLRVGVGVGSG